MRLIIRRFRFGYLLVVFIQYKSPGAWRTFWRCPHFVSMQVVRVAHGESHMFVPKPIHSACIHVGFTRNIFATHSALYILHLYIQFWRRLVFLHTSLYYRYSHKCDRTFGGCFGDVTNLWFVPMVTAFSTCAKLKFRYLSNYTATGHRNMSAGTARQGLLTSFAPIFSDEKGCFFLSCIRESHYSKIYWHDYGDTV